MLTNEGKKYHDLSEQEIVDELLRLLNPVLDLHNAAMQKGINISFAIAFDPNKGKWVAQHVNLTKNYYKA